MTEGLRAGDRMVERPDETTIRYSITGPSEGSRALPPCSGHGICGYAASGSVAVLWLRS